MPRRRMINMDAPEYPEYREKALAIINERIEAVVEERKTYPKKAKVYRYKADEKYTEKMVALKEEYNFLFDIAFDRHMKSFHSTAGSLAENFDKMVKHMYDMKDSKYEEEEAAKKIAEEKEKEEAAKEKEKED